MADIGFQALPDEPNHPPLRRRCSRWQGLAACAACACILLFISTDKLDKLKTVVDFDDGEPEVMAFEEFPEEAYAPMVANLTLATLLDFPASVKEANDFMVAQPELAKDLLQRVRTSRLETLFKDFLTTIGSTAATGDMSTQYATQEEHNHRFELFKQSLATIIDLNLDSKLTDGSLHRARYGITQLVDWSAEEYDIIANGSYGEDEEPTSAAHFDDPIDADEESGAGAGAVMLEASLDDRVSVDGELQKDEAAPETSSDEPTDMFTKTQLNWKQQYETGGKYSFILGSVSSVRCPVGSAALVAADCQSAARAYREKYVGTLNRADRPSGCVYQGKGNGVYFNSVKAGHTAPNRQRICKRVPGSSCTWSELGPAINQGKCGSCWAHAVDAALRTGMYVRYKKDPGYLSTQYIIDCDPDTLGQKCYTGGVTGPAGPAAAKRPPSKTLKGINGCCGGITGKAFDYIARVGGVPTMKDYGNEISRTKPNISWKCKVPKRRMVTTDGSIFLKGEYQMSTHLCKSGGIAVSVWADTAVQHYIGGVIRKCSVPAKGRTSHAIELLGIDKNYPGGPVWILRNSWGPQWGVSSRRPYKTGGGYFLMQYGMDMCNIITRPYGAKNVRWARR
eukprot:TRINITY_DN36108_c0_g1_i1.p1 TRINITY_DN36108_c0_g1~~TRINITY_DN36108_c0_g1_i1.p1  ORF type:complete len:633 (+),score=82.86 TRINITY_DN36108_c0_g1_i1:34-1899(+)